MSPSDDSSHNFTGASSGHLARRQFLQRTAAAGLASALPFPSLLAAEGTTKATSGGEPKVHTVLGPVAPHKLGVTLMHEHAPLVDWSELYEAPVGPVEPVRDEMLAALKQALQAFHRSLPAADAPGTIVECMPIRAGRYPQLLVDLARAVPVHIVACTGFWAEAAAPQHSWALQLACEKDGVKKMAELFIREITEGMEDPSGEWGEKFTQIKAGIIKCATSKFLRPSERRCHEASAIASRETGCPITTHTTDGGGLEEAELLLKSGARPEKIIIGHQGSQDDRAHDEAHEYHRQIASLGCYVQFDRVGGGRYSPDKIARQIKNLVDAGYKQQILLSHDHTPYFYPDYTATKKTPAGWRVQNADFTIVPIKLSAACAAEGISPADFRLMLIDNPQRVLAF